MRQVGNRVGNAADTKRTDEATPPIAAIGREQRRHYRLQAQIYNPRAGVPIKAFWLVFRAKYLGTPAESTGPDASSGGYSTPGYPNPQ
jgi:hypothetical protein